MLLYLLSCHYNMKKRSSIIVCNDLKEQIDSIVLQKDYERIEVYRKDKILIDDVREIQNEAYIAESGAKLIVIASKDINIVAQNGLLKLIEEPNKNIYFKIIVLNSSILLPTIRSRLPIENFKTKKKDFLDLKIRFKNFALNDYYEFIRKYGIYKGEDAKLLIESILMQSLNENIYLNAKQLELFSNCYKLVDLNSKFSNLLMLLMFYFTKKKA